jgi:predicted RNA binding protein YcfA (HicA-like mRNA interferase family)
MKNVKDIMRSLEKLGFSISYGNGSIAKIYHPDKNKPFYSFHIGERGLHPLRRFAKKNWDINLENL